MFSFPDLTAYLQRRLSEPLPGFEAQRRLAPALRQDPSNRYVAGRSCREAGVLALLYPDEGRTYLVLTVRRDDLPDHPGQISFPGGSREEGESLEETALREAWEEIGLARNDVRLIGSLTPLYIPPSRYCVYPFVGVVPEKPHLAPHDDEVARILHVPLDRLAHPESVRREPWTLHGREIEVPYFEVESPPIWGATAMMLAELIDLLPSGHPAD